MHRIIFSYEMLPCLKNDLFNNTWHVGTKNIEVQCWNCEMCPRLLCIAYVCMSYGPFCLKTIPYQHMNMMKRKIEVQCCCFEMCPRQTIVNVEHFVAYAFGILVFNDYSTNQKRFEKIISSTTLALLYVPKIVLYKCIVHVRIC